MSLDFDLVDGLSTAVLLLDQKLRLVRVNPAAQSLISTSETKIKDARLNEVLPACEELAAAARRALTEARSFTERGLDLKLGRLHPTLVDCTVTPLWRSGREPS